MSLKTAIERSPKRRPHFFSRPRSSMVHSILLPSHSRRVKNSVETHESSCSSTVFRRCSQRHTHKNVVCWFLFILIDIPVYPAIASCNTVTRVKLLTGAMIS